jgi:hypothetical protein
MLMHYHFGNVLPLKQGTAVRSRDTAFSVDASVELMPFLGRVPSCLSRAARRRLGADPRGLS